uniref:Mucin 2, oligomeric mucus/gel-forming n=1 Tax=Corvus moneduloides TaxID=1196302 RepID=A0A8C3EH44_CORMO
MEHLPFITLDCLLHFFSSLFLFHHLTGRTRNHGHYVCSTWGNNHFKTFDGDVYQFPGICEYNFVSDCREAYREFSVHIQRALNSNGHPEIQYILMKIKDIMVYLKPNLVVVDGRIVKTPYYSSGVLIESGEIYTKIYAKLGMVLMWNQQDALMVELDNKFNNHTCGLCGDYNGIPIYNEFIDGGDYNSITYGNLQKISKPNAKCEDPDETQALPSCNKHRDECQRLLTSPAFADCRLRLNLEMYIQACMQDMCACNGKEDSFCLCSTISEYSRQCSHAGGRPGEWRTQNFCPKTCPATMVYRESSSPCMDTCSHLEISSLCEEHYMDGCFCPEGTVYDDISEKGCIPVSQCHCKLGGKTYAPGESISKECEECTCNSGRWTCKDLPCPGICSVEGGSHITTFDGKKYTFHGDCYYVLAKGTAKESYGLLAELAPCGSTDKQTCLKTVVLLVDNKKNVVVFRSDGSVLLNEMTVNVPHVSASFSIFKPSSNYFVVQTSFGLQMQIQLFRVMQLFVTVDQSVKGKLQGLCGNFNGMEGDDFRTTSGLIEATGSAFANTWKAQSTCTDQAEKLEDPCSLSIESANYAEHWCSLLRNPKGPFARCHLVIDPTEYYKKCKYDTCLCEDNEECLCAALSSYSRACAFKGIILGGWRKSVCSKYEASSCPGNQVFLYNLTKCQQTCRSLADGEKYCLQDFAPVDGCGCPPNTYLDNQDECVPISQCPCYYKGSYLEPGQYFTKDGERWYVLFWLFVCGEKALKKNCLLGARCLWTSQTPVQLSCHTPQIDHCVSGCVCPQGLFDDGRGGCVEQKNCPCSHNNDWYSSGEKIKVDCNTCTCQKGTWKCTDNVCYGTCMIYGSGHYNTFDGKFYDFDGSCEYVATQDFCGDKNSSGSFSIITENVPCGTTGVTCSKAIKMFLGKTELKLENKDYKEIQRDVGDDVQYWNRTVGLYLVIEASNGVMLIWDKKTTVFIKLSPDYKGKVCGLCGNFDDKANNDFTTRSGLQESNPLEFGNSWKQSPMCPDVTEEIKPCDLKPHRKSWAEKECSIIQSEVFKICHSKVNPLPFYEACVHDACSCDSGGDCECFCSAVAAYAQECIKAEACVFWRTPDICPIFCDYYNPRNECDWHYEPCGSNITTCRMINNVSTNFTIPLLEGCYPRCPMDKPIYNEETKECVTEDECGCYIEGGIHIPPGQEVPTKENWCPCVINGTSYEVGAVVGQVQDGDMCITYICAENGSVVPGGVYPCPTSSPTTISTSFPSSTLTTTTTITTTTAPCFGLICDWTEWFDVSKPEEGGGDYETYDEIRNHGNKICTAPEQIECRAKDKPDVSLDDLGQKVECNVTYGLICKNDEQDVTMWQLCYNYEIRVNCCEWQEIPCGPTITPTVPHTPASTTTKTTVPTTTTTRTSTEITTPPVHIHSTTSEHTPSVPSPVTSTSTETPTTTSSTPQTTTTVPVSTTPISTTSSTSTPTPTYTTTLPTPGTSLICALMCSFPIQEMRVPSLVCPHGIADGSNYCASSEVAVPKAGLLTVSEGHRWVQGVPRAPPVYVLVPWIVTSDLSVSNCPSCCHLPGCDCIWTDWIDVSYPDSSDRNSGDYETFENILKNDPSWVCAKAENISCRAEKFPNTSIADLGQKVECNVNVGLICNNKDQQIGGIIPMPVCLNYEISICCTPNKPECLPTPSTTSTSTSTPSSTTSAVSSTTISTTAPTPTAEETPSMSEGHRWVQGVPRAPPVYVLVPWIVTSDLSVSNCPSCCHLPGCDCIWTDWIDVSYPDSSDRNSGDYETFENILKNDPSWVCAKAENISCRAEKFPNTSIADLGQKVECNVNVGLICNNKDQQIGGIIPMPVCLNYEISICCTPNKPECLPTPSTTSTSTSTPSSTTSAVSSTTISTTAPTPTAEETPSSTTPTTPTTATTTPMPPSTTTPTSSTPQTTTTVPVSTTPISTTSSTSTPTPTYTTTLPTPGTSPICALMCSFPIQEMRVPSLVCPHGIADGSNYCASPEVAVPKSHCFLRFVSVSSLLLSFQTQEGDSWWLCECIKAICVEDNVVQVIPVICNPPPKPTCANGLSPVPVIDEDGCCWHWECDCYCTGWGDPHYMTFDGLYYSFQGNCTYVLVEEINKKVDNFGVYIDNYYCDARDVVSCPRTLIVRHETQEVRLRTAQPNTLQVTVNNQLVALPYKKFGVSIYESGINRVVEIPELKMNVTYNGLSFSIRMPYSLFGNNTQGQCGTCNNNTADDCMLPDGNIAENCEIMADHWQVVDPSKPQCSPGLVPTGSPSTTPTQPCKESSICELLLGSVFEPCHALVQPDKYYAACVFDSCVLPNLDLECSSLQIYAATCADQGACIDWRKHTNGHNPAVCAYEVNGVPLNILSHRGQNDTSTKQAEGCFCPNGTMLYDSGVDVCVKTCGEFYCFPWMYFGERFTMDCQDCICLEGEHGIVCEPHECDQKKVTCDGEGFYEIQEVNPKDPCCPLFTCKCNTSFCTAKAPKCSLGFEVHSYIPSGQCCPVYQCVPKGVCVHGNAEFLPNSSVFVDKCQNCFCTNDVNISTQLNIISCEHVPCNTYCQPGYELKPVKGECCGKCVQTKCIIHTADNSELILSVSMLYVLCLHQICKVPSFRKGTSPCQRQGFSSNVAIFGVNRYSAEANSMDHSCSCCRETSTTEKHVVLKCPGGHSMSHKYIYVESCSCQDTECRNPKLNDAQPLGSFSNLLIFSD